MGVVSLAGCAGPEYSVRTVTPRQDLEVLTVIPRDLSPKQTDWAADIQRCLLMDRLRVIERPALDETETKSAAARDESERAERKTEVTIDVVATYAKSDATIIVSSDSTSRRVKFIDKRHQNQILLSGQVPKPEYHYSAEPTCPWIHKRLIMLGWASSAQ